MLRCATCRACRIGQRLAYRQLSTAAAHAAQSAPGRGGIEPPLKGLRIVDLTRVLAGPYSTMLLADLGADVIKIEHPTRGDDTRAWYPPFAPSTGAKAHPAPPALAQDGSEKVSTTKDDSQADWSNLPPESAYFLSVNRGKRSLGLNLKTQEGQAIVKELIKKADVLVENYVPGKLAEMGLGYEDCHSINPGIIYASITGYGQTGPFRTAPGYDVMIEAEAGLMHITGEPDRAPVKVGVAITDLTTGLYVHGAIMAALLGRARTGKGAWIDASLFDSQIASLANIGSNYLIAGQEATRQGTAHPSIVPYETFATKDSFIMIGAGNDGQFRILSRLLGQPGWSDEARFKTNGDRVANRAILKDLITRALSAQTTTSWVEAFTGKGIPFAPINNIKGTFEHAQAKARGVVVEVEHARAGRIKQLAPAMYYNGQRMPVNRPPPVLAQHTAEVLAEELGYDVEKIRQLRASKTADASMTPSGQRRGTRMAKPRSALSYHEDIACPYPVVDHLLELGAWRLATPRVAYCRWTSDASERLMAAWRGPDGVDVAPRVNARMQHGRAASGLQPDQGNDELGHQTRQQDSSSLGNEPGRSHNPYENCSRSDQEAYPPYSAAKSSTALHTASPSLAQSNHSPWDASDYPAEPIDSPGLHSSGYEARTYLQSQNPASYGAQSAWSHGTAQDEAEVRREPYETMSVPRHHHIGEADEVDASRSAKMTSEQYSGLPSASSREASPYSSERKPACRSSASQIPLTEAAYPPTCFEASKSSKGEPTADETDYLDTLPKGDRPRKRRRVRFGDIFGRGSSGSDGSERKIYCNDPERNAQQRYKNNSVSTTKYNLATFLPKFLGEQFSKYANVFFLFTACVQQIPNVSPTNRFTTIVPLFIVLLVAAFKELQEDLKRHASDRALNGRQVNVLQDRAFVARQWRDLRVGDIVRLVSDDSFPADLLLLSSSEPDGLCYIETSNLDGETNLKIKQASPETAHLMSPEAIAGLDGYLRSEQPNNSLYTYEGTLAVPRKSGAFREVPMSPQQILLRGAQLRNTAWMYGLVVFTGHETKLMRNATATPVKRTAVERMVNVQILFLFLILLLLGFGSAFGAYIREHVYGDQMWYLLLGSETASSRTMTFVEDILTFIILYNNLIPISLIVTMEVVKFQQAVLINADLDMYYDKTKTAALCRTSSLVEELGQIEYVFSDKTGTLTCNEMQFRQCSIAGKRYADHVDESTGADVFSFTDLKRHAVAPDLADVIKEFLTLLATCHTVIPEQKASKIVYQASSPDEAALVSGAEMLDYRFTTRKPHAVIIDVDGRSEEHLVLNVCEFNSTRKRMSTILRGPDGRIKLYCKGADTVILERMSGQQSYTTDTLSHLQQYATEGLRTLCIAMREIPEDEYRQWSQVYDRAAATINGRSEALDQAAELIEKDLTLLGATAIEDRLQDGVPDTIHTLQQAGIKVWVLTGDRQETAINIGLSCRLISDAMELVIINEDDALATKAFIDKRLAMLDGKVDVPPLALIIDGKSLAFALEKPLSKDFLRLAVKCKAVVCCRVSPLQKALVVKLVKKNEKAILLAIGDGANDIGMIQAAHLGVGISGVEGLQAARSADVAISQFRYLKKLLLVHGAWSYRRLSLLILYSFYKNAVISAISFWFSFNSSFSGQVLYESWTLTMYNIFFTVLPPLALGVFDQFVNARMLDRYPELYLLGQRNAFFTKRIFWCWFLDAIYHSIIIFVCAAGVFWDDLVLTDGLDAGQWLFGTTVYMCVLLTVLLKAALVANTWTKYTVMAIPGSFLFAAVFLPAFQALAPIIGFATEYHGIVPRLWASPVFYFCLALLPVACLLRDLGWKSYKRLFNPQPYHIVQEIQALNLPDYRPRMAQFQRAIKKVRAVQHLRQNNGYAFSQTEGGQADLMKLYDTTIPRQQG